MAARRGHVHAQAELAEAYLSGEGVLPDNRKAYRWALKAVQGGSGWAKTVLGWATARLSDKERHAIEEGMAAWRPETEPPAFIVRTPALPFVLVHGLGIKACEGWFW